jgi:hypothetical protein
MLSTVPAMLKYFLHRAARFFERIGKNGHPLESPVVVDLLGKGFHVGSEPPWVESHGTKGVAEDAPENLDMLVTVVSTVVLMRKNGNYG